MRPQFTCMKTVLTKIMFRFPLRGPLIDQLSVTLVLCKVRMTYPTSKKATFHMVEGTLLAVIYR